MIRANDWLRLRLIGLVVCVLLAGFAATNIISYRNAAAILKATILHRELPLTGNNIYSEIQADLIRPVFISSIMANDTFVKDWLLGGEQDRSQLERYLGTIEAKYGVFTAFLVSDKTLNYYHHQTQRRPIDANNADDIWYFRAKTMKTPYEINIDYDLVSNRTLTIFVNYRVLDYQGNFLGVTGVGLNIDSVQRIVQRYNQNFQRSVYFVTRAGDVTVTSSGGPPTGGNIHTLAGLRSVADGILNTQEGQFEYSRNGDTYLLDARFIPELGWYVVVEQRQSDVLAGLWSGFITNLWIGAAIICLTAAIIALTIAKYHRKLERATSRDRGTGLYSRPAFDSAVARLLAPRFAREPFAIMLIDIDNLEALSDRLGYRGVEQVIQQVSARVISGLQPKDLASRWGGDQLIVLMRDCGLDEARVRAETLRLAVGGASLAATDDPAVTLSIGVAARSPGDSLDTLLGRAHTALRAARRAGRNRVKTAQAAPASPAAADAVTA